MNEAPLMLSVSGLRGLVGRSLTPVVAARYGAAAGSWFVETRGTPSPRIVIGRDSRPSGAMVEAAAAAGLMSMGCRVTRLGIATTPGVAVMVDELGADGGMVVTASHNPIEWNGIKTLRHDGAAPPAEEAGRIIERFKAERLDYVGVESTGSMDEEGRTNDIHVRRVLAAVDVEAIRRLRPRVVLDSVCGAGGPEGALLLRELGAELIHVHGEPTGRFPHGAEPTAENLTSLCDDVRREGAAIGFAQDPDADRLAIVDENGVYIGEEYTLALAAMRVLARQPGAAVANLSTSRMVDDIAARFNCKVHRSAVGEANVVEAMRRHGAVIGGEGNGGVILPGVIGVRDSLVAIALVLDLVASERRPLSAIVADIPRYVIRKEKLPIAPGMASRAITAMQTAFPDATVNTLDGIRLDWPDRWVHVRPSNTEAILRIIAEARTDDDARSLIAAASRAVNR